MRRDDEETNQTEKRPFLSHSNFFFSRFIFIFTNNFFRWFFFLHSGQLPRHHPLSLANTRGRFLVFFLTRGSRRTTITTQSHSQTRDWGGFFYRTAAASQPPPLAHQREVGVVLSSFFFGAATASRPPDFFFHYFFIFLQALVSRLHNLHNKN
jgi:hypothetical protein